MYPPFATDNSGFPVLLPELYRKQLLSVANGGCLYCWSLIPHKMYLCSLIVSTCKYSSEFNLWLHYFRANKKSSIAPFLYSDLCWQEYVVFVEWSLLSTSNTISKNCKLLLSTKVRKIITLRAIKTKTTTNIAQLARH